MGSIITQKGIVELMKIWDLIEKKFPQAELNIIGSGKLYNNKFKLGELGIADEVLEKKLKPYICNKNGEIKANIHFLGIMGEEKYNVFSNVAVGIVNPSAKTETFGMGIIEMASMKLPVVTKGWNGHFDTIINGETGLTAFTIKGMAKQIEKLFVNKELNLELGQKAKNRMDQFAPQKIAKIWVKFIQELHNSNYEFKHLKLSKPYWNNYKFIRGISYFIRIKLNIRFLPSIVDIETLINDMLKKL